MLKTLPGQVRQATREALQGAQNLTADQRSEKTVEARGKVLKKALETLTPEQREKFEKLKGAKIDMDFFGVLAEIGGVQIGDRVPEGRGQASGRRIAGLPPLLKWVDLSRCCRHCAGQKGGIPSFLFPTGVVYFLLNEVAVFGSSAPSEGPDESHCVSWSGVFDAAFDCG